MKINSASELLFFLKTRLKSGIRALQSGISIQVTMNLDLVLGLSCNNKGALACDPEHEGLVAHTASGVLVLLNTKSNW
ncbi:hypothetical protein RRG08_053494 [Elysia crispata]|uniref:Uncharacterized protein n=1 Tax=Elysia crispata TaxID=231223 RepID=A0AAE0Y249_9GAST|nr:hypothetical protein RRG08_053494 [Elysia crispata]